VAHIQRLVATDPKGQRIILSDRLNTHHSASLVEWVAAALQLEDDLGEKGKSGILANMASRHCSPF